MPAAPRASSPQRSRCGARRSGTRFAGSWTPDASTRRVSTPTAGPRRSLPPSSRASRRYNGRTMGIYRRILLVVDLGEECEQIGARARDVAALTGAELSVLHVVEYVPVEPMGETLLPAVQIEEELVQRATRRLGEFAEQLGIPAGRRQVAAGNIKAEIVRAAQEQKADLIVLGSRERRGPSILVNFTEDTVLHAAPCDVLAVRLR